MWIEAIAPGPGTGPDRVPELPADHQARSVPDDQIQLRYLSAIDEKHRKLGLYQQKKAVAQEEPYIIALNGADATQSGDFDPPRIVRCLFGIHMPIAHYSTTQKHVEGYSWQRRQAVEKANGQDISTTGFLGEGMPGVSAVIFSLATPWNGIHETGKDFVVVHNPNAKNKLPVRLLPARREYWVEEDRLTSG
jgi:type I restriction enzyme S subunit